MIFTVFTSSYNRADVLCRVYESLKSQTLFDFEWLIIDDGSKDHTQKLVSQWQQSPETWFPVRYIWQENQHKKAAHNRALKEADGEFLVILDSDDRCVSTALEVLHDYWVSISAGERSNFVGVVALCMDANGEIVGDKFPCEGWIDSDALEMAYRYKVRGEKWGGAMRLDVLRQFPFPEHIPGLVPESVVWSRIARKYKSRFFNDALRIYLTDQAGLITREGEVFDAERAAAGIVYGKNSVLSNDLDWFGSHPLWFSMEAARLSRFYWQVPVDQRDVVDYWPRTVLGSLLVIGALPLAVVMFLRDAYHKYSQTN